MFQEFKDFALKGNVLELAVAVVIGTAFAKITSSLVANIITPLIGIALGGIDITSRTLEVGNAQVGYGLFVQAIIDFLIIALVLFIIIRSIAKAQERRDPKEETQEEAPLQPTQEELLTEIRDLLKKDRA